MNISWHKKKCIELGIPSKKNGNTTIIIDPLERSGKKKMEADIFLLTDKEEIKTSSLLINGPGEYEIKEIYIMGIEASNKRTLYFIEGDEMRICHLGSFNEEELSSNQVEEIGDIDILFLPISPNPKTSVKIMNQVEPKITIPINHQGDELKEFLKITGEKSPEIVSKLSIKKKLIGEESKIIVLE